MSKLYSKTKIIKASSFLPKAPDLPEDASPEQVMSAYVSPRDSVLLGLFGDLPDYDDERLEHLWKRVLDANELEMFAYAKGKGVDLMQEDGDPIDGWRDVVVMLQAIDKKIIETV